VAVSGGSEALYVESAMEYDGQGYARSAHGAVSTPVTVRASLSAGLLPFPRFLSRWDAHLRT